MNMPTSMMTTGMLDPADRARLSDTSDLQI